MSQSLIAEVIRDEAGLRALAAQWWELWRLCPAATPFQTPAWLIPWWRHFAPGALRTVAVREDRRLVALAPFYVEEGGWRRLLPLGISVSDYLDVLVDPACAGAGEALASALAEEPWDDWSLEELAPGAAGLDLPRPFDCDEVIAEQSACPVLIFADGSDALAASLPSTKRRKLNLARNRVARRGGTISAVGADAVQAFLDDLVRLHGARWTSRGEPGVLADARVRAFHREAVPALVAAGLARLFTLEIEGRVAAAYFGFHHRDRAFAYLTGIDPDFGFESPGALLTGHAVSEALREGAREFHFLRGQETYKYQWGALDRWNRRRVLTRRAAPALTQGAA